MFEVKRVVVGQDLMVERMLVGLLARGHVLLEGVPGVAKTLAVKTLADVVGGTLLPAAVHPGPDAGRHRRHPGVAALDRTIRHRARAGVRQPGAGRRDQPGTGQGAVGAAGGDGGAAGQHRRHHPPAADAVPGAGHPEPDRDRGRLHAARGAAGPVPAEGRRRPRRRAGRADHRAADERRPAAGGAGADRGGAGRAAGGDRPGLRPPRRRPLRGAAGDGHPAPAPVRPEPGRRAGVRGQRPRQLWAWSPPPAPWPCCAGGTTCCPTTWSTSPATCSLTGWCCPSTRSPRASTRARSWPGAAVVPRPQVAPDEQLARAA